MNGWKTFSVEYFTFSGVKTKGSLVCFTRRSIVRSEAKQGSVSGVW